MTLEDGRDLATALSNGELGDADFGLHYIGLSGTDVTDKVDGLTVDGELAFDAGTFTSLQFGAASTGRSKTRDTIENDTNGGSCIYCNLYDVTFASLGAQVVRDLSPAELHAQRRRQLPEALRLLRRAAVPRRARRARRAADPRRERRPDRRGLRLLAGGAGVQPGAVLRRGRGHARGLRQRQLRRGQLVRERRPALDQHRHDGADRDRQHRARRRSRRPGFRPRARTSPTARPSR